MEEILTISGRKASRNRDPFESKRYVKDVKHISWEKRPNLSAAIFFMDEDLARLSVSHHDPLVVSPVMTRSSGMPSYNFILLRKISPPSSLWSVAFVKHPIKFRCHVDQTSVFRFGCFLEFHDMRFSPQKTRLPPWLRRSTVSSSHFVFEN